MQTEPVASVVRGGLTAQDIERMNEQLTNPAVAGSEPPPPLPALKKGEKCFRSTQGLRRLVKDVKDQVVNGIHIPGSRKWAEFKKHISGSCFELVTSDEETIENIEAEIERTGGVLVWEAQDQIEQHEDARAVQIAAELAAKPELRARVSAIGAQAASFSLEPVKKATPAPKSEAPKQPEKKEP